MRRGDRHREIGFGGRRRREWRGRGAEEGRRGSGRALFETMEWGVLYGGRAGDEEEGGHGTGDNEGSRVGNQSAYSLIEEIILGFGYSTAVIVVQYQSIEGAEGRLL